MTNSIAILGASGYAGAELLRLLGSDCDSEVVVVTGDSQKGKKVAELYPHLASSYPELVFESTDSARVRSARVVFSALPHGESMSILPQLNNELIIDLGSDFRLKAPALYPQWYAREHISPEQLAKWTYGLPELFREQIVTSKRIANPGCYATAITLALAPLVAEDLIKGDIVVNALSGTSGAGRNPAPNLHFANVFENITAYKPGTHQHTAEIEQSLSVLNPDSTPMVSITPHLAPITRGIHATCSAQLKTKGNSELVEKLFREFYKNEPFVKISSIPCGCKETRGSNSVVLYSTVDPRTQRVIVISVLDNLIKGAAGQAIQNMNLALGLPETKSLNAIGLYP